MYKTLLWAEVIEENHQYVRNILASITDSNSEKGFECIDNFIAKTMKMCSYQ